MVLFKTEALPHEESMKGLFKINQFRICGFKYLCIFRNTTFPSMQV